MSGANGAGGAEPPCPVVVRIAGLPTEAVECLSTALCDLLPEGERAEAELAAARGALAERLFARVPGAPAPLRRLLLAARRDAHNGRPLARHLGSPLWPALREAGGAALERVAELEGRLEGWEGAFRAAFLAERERARRALLEQAADPAFRRGLALASPGLAEVLPRLRGSRRDERARTALLRYVSRAALKVSPFSTLTPVALGTLRALVPGGVRLRGARWSARSLVRLKRFVLHQHAEALLRWPAVREALPVALNDSLAELSPGRVLFLRPARWESDPGGGAPVHRPEELVRATLHGPVPGCLAALLAEGSLPWGALLARAAEALAGEVDAAGVRGQAETLLELGVLRPVLPWPAHEGHLERRMPAALRALPAPAGPALAAYLARLERVVALEEGFAAAADPAAHLRALRGAVEEAWRAVAAAGGMAGGEGSPAHALYEDVLLRAAGEDAPAEILHLSRPAVEEALRHAALLVRVSALFDHGQELRRTAAAFAAARWPGRREVGALELFAQMQPLWREFAREHGEWWRGKDPAATWNPLGLPELEALAGWRRAVLEGLPGTVRPCGEDEQRVDPAALEALLEGVPGRFADAAPWGACLLLLPASTDGSRWVLNRLKEGTGRYGSRYTPAMEEGVRRWYTGHLAARGVVEAGGEPAELLDVLSVQGDTLNVHAPHTPRVLTLPGDEAEVAPARRVRLRDLVVRLEEGGGATLRGPGGRRLLPVHLGMAFAVYMPHLPRFLCAFGPNEMGGVFPGGARRREGVVPSADRTVLGNLVLQRRSWWLPAAELAAAAAHPDEARAFAGVNRLRLRWGIPERVFASEREPSPFFGTVVKPQYLDFTSPLFLPLLRAALERTGETLAVSEVLPTPEMCPADASGRRWAVEVVVDTLALRDPHPAAVALLAEETGMEELDDEALDAAAGGVRPFPLPDA